MQIGMIGLGRMGGNMVRRLMRAGHQCVVHARETQSMDALAAEGAVAARTLAELAERLAPPRAVWIMVPAAAVDDVIGELSRVLAPGDLIVDGGNSHYRHDLERAARLDELGLQYVDAGTSGGVWGLERGYCLMIGGSTESVARLRPALDALAPGVEAAPRTPGRDGEPAPAEHGWLHCGGHGAGHFVKMVHNGIEYGVMAAYAEGLNILRHADSGVHAREVDAETAPMGDPAAYRYAFDVAAIVELWRRGSVLPSWLLDLTAQALHENPTLDGYDGRVSDSGEGRWALAAAIDEGVPAPVLSAALFGRFGSRGADRYAGQVLSAMRHAFGGHAEKPHPAARAPKERS